MHTEDRADKRREGNNTISSETSNERVSSSFAFKYLFNRWTGEPGTGRWKRQRRQYDDGRTRNAREKQWADHAKLFRSRRSRGTKVPHGRTADFCRTQKYHSGDRLTDTYTTDFYLSQCARTFALCLFPPSLFSFSVSPSRSFSHALARIRHTYCSSNGDFLIQESWEQSPVHWRNGQKFTWSENTSVQLLLRSKLK